MDPSTPLRVVIAGTGRFGALHARTWTERGASLAGLADPDEARLAEVASRFGVTETGTDAAEVIGRVTPDVVVVASDEASHTGIALAALGEGSHVLVEKPFSLTTADALRVRDAARAAGREVIAGHISRFAQPYQSMREAVEEGRIGSLWSVRLRRDFSRSWYASFGDRVHPAWESCVHDIDLALMFTGARPTRVVAMNSEAAGQAAPSVVSALVGFDNGVMATIESAWTVPGQGPQTESGALELPGTILGEAEAHGSGGIVRQRLVDDALTVWNDEATWAPNPFLWPLAQGAVGGALRAEVEYAIEVFSGRRANDLIPMDQAVDSVVIAEALVEALRTGDPVTIDAPAR